MPSGKNFQVRLAIVVAVVVAIDPGNDPASWHIISTSACCQPDDPITYPEFDNDSDSDNELIRKMGVANARPEKGALYSYRSPFFY